MAGFGDLGGFSSCDDSMNLGVVGVPLSSRAAVGELSLPALGREGRGPHSGQICCSTPFGTGWNIQPGKEENPT